MAARKAKEVTRTDSRGNPLLPDAAILDKAREIIAGKQTKSPHHYAVVVVDWDEEYNRDMVEQLDTSIDDIRGSGGAEIVAQWVE